MNCQFSEPVNLASEPNQDFEYSVLNCTNTNEVLISHPTSTAGNFTIEKIYTYGDITEILLLGSIFFISIFYLFKRLFLHDSVKNIHKNFF